MGETKVEFIVFSKPWKCPIPELGALISNLGFEGIELPVRPGFLRHLSLTRRVTSR